MVVVTVLPSAGTTEEMDWSVTPFASTSRATVTAPVAVVVVTAVATRAPLPLKSLTVRVVEPSALSTVTSVRLASVTPSPVMSI